MSEEIKRYIIEPNEPFVQLTERQNGYVCKYEDHIKIVAEKDKEILNWGLISALKSDMIGNIKKEIAAAYIVIDEKDKEMDRLKSLLDSSKIIVELWDAKSTAQKEWKRNYLVNLKNSLV